MQWKNIAMYRNTFFLYRDTPTAHGTYVDETNFLKIDILTMIYQLYYVLFLLPSLNIPI